MRIAPALLIAAATAACGSPSGDAASRYNQGTALLAGGRFEESRPHLQAASRSGAGTVRQAAYYNLGNSDLEPQFAAGAGGVDRSAVVRAIVAYKRALVLDPRDVDAKWNLELARRLLREENRPPPRPDPQAGGGGGQGGGGGDEPRSGRRDPTPQGASGSGPQPPLSRAEAERLLANAQDREVGLQRAKLRKQQPRSTSAH